MEKTESLESKAPHAAQKTGEEDRPPVLLPASDRVSISAGLRERTKAVEDLVTRAKALGEIVDPKHEARLEVLRSKLESGNLLNPEVLKETARKLYGDL